MAITVMMIAPASAATARRDQIKPSILPIEDATPDAKCSIQDIWGDVTKEARQAARRNKGGSVQPDYSEIVPLLNAYKERGVYTPLKNWAATQGKDWKDLNLQERILTLNKWTAAGRPGFGKD